MIMPGWAGEAKMLLEELDSTLALLCEEQTVGRAVCNVAFGCKIYP